MRVACTQLWGKMLKSTIRDLILPSKWRSTKFKAFKRESFCWLNSDRAHGGEWKGTLPFKSSHTRISLRSVHGGLWKAVRVWHISPGQHRWSAAHQLANNKTARSYSQKMRAPPAVIAGPAFTGEDAGGESLSCVHTCRLKVKVKLKSQVKVRGSASELKLKAKANTLTISKRLIHTFSDRTIVAYCCVTLRTPLFSFFFSLAHHSLPLSFSLIDSLFLWRSVLSFLFCPVRYEPDKWKTIEKISR